MQLGRFKQARCPAAASVLPCCGVSLTRAKFYDAALGECNAGHKTNGSKGFWLRVTLNAVGAEGSDRRTLTASISTDAVLELLPTLTFVAPCEQLFAC